MDFKQNIIYFYKSHTDLMQNSMTGLTLLFQNFKIFTGRRNNTLMLFSS